jgi:YHS domain-containing protein
MLRILLLVILCIVIARLFWRIVEAIIDGARGGARGPTSAVKLVRDPVCGTFVDPQTALSATASGGAYYFCSAECRRKFTEGSRQ